MPSHGSVIPYTPNNGHKSGCQILTFGSPGRPAESQKQCISNRVPGDNDATRVEIHF